jgi:SRSO17 transposase
MQGHRYFVERALENAKQQGGFGEYQVRGWRGWHHHVALVMMAMLFLTRERLEIGEPVLTAADVQMMLVHYLPRRNRTQRISSISYDDVLNGEEKSFPTRPKCDRAELQLS